MPKCKQCGNAYSILSGGDLLGRLCQSCLDANLVKETQRVADGRSALDNQQFEEERQRLAARKKEIEALGLDSQAHQADRLEELLEINKKQLYWLRIVGLFYLITFIVVALIALLRNAV